MDDGYGLRVEGEGGAIASGVEGGLGRIEENTMEIMRLWRKCQSTGGTLRIAPLDRRRPLFAIMPCGTVERLSDTHCGK
jgi:hypothetical protein